MTDSSTPLTIDVVSDVVCPWCFIGKRRLEKAIALVPEIPVAVRFHPYFLNPWVPREGMSRADYLTQKFGSVDRYKDIAQRVSGIAAEEGLVYALDAGARQPNTLDSHRLILWAGEIGKAAEMKQRLMELYFSEGGDLTDPEVLVKAAQDVGLDADKVRSLLAGDTDVERVTNAADSAKNSGINGVPFFILAGKYGLSGAQEPAALADAIRQVAAERDNAVAAE